MNYSLDTTLGGKGQKGDQSLSQTELLCLLISGIGRHAVEEDPGELERFQALMTAQEDRLKATSDKGEMRLAVEAVIGFLAHHNEAVKTDQRARSAELTKALRMMSETIGQVGRSSQAAVHQLAVIEKGLEEATATNDINRLRLRLGVCLKMIREQSDGLKVQSEQHLGQLKALAASSSSAGLEVALLEEPLDPVTGLPARTFAETLIKERFERKTDCLIGLICANRMAGFQVRFGQPAMNDVMKTMARELVQRLPVGTTLCRWSGYSFVAVTDITSSYAEISQQWRKVGGFKVEKHIDDRDRSAFISVGTSILLEHVRRNSSRRELIQNMERFVAQCGGLVV